jgi:hypothetical protein
VEGADALVVDVDEAEVVEALEHEVRGVVVDGAGDVPAHRVEEHLEGGAVEDVLARMDLVAVGDAVLARLVEDGAPAAAELGEGLLDEPSGRWARDRT